MNRLQSLANQYKCDPMFDKKRTGKEGFIAGFIAARKMCSIMGQIAQIEGKSIEKEILAVGTEDVKGAEIIPIDELTGIAAKE